MYTVRLSEDLTSQLRNAGRQIRYAAAVALTRTAKDVQVALYGEMRVQFNAPTPYTLNSLRVKSATKETLEAGVLPKTDTSNNGSRADKYLSPEIFGGDRRIKGIERRLLAVGLMKQGQYAVPGSGAQLDAYGNMNRGQVIKILSQLGALLQFTSRTASQSTLNRLQKKGLLVGRAKGVKGQKGFAQQRTTVYSQYFIAKSKATGNPLGIYQLIGRGKVEPVIAFVSKPSYSARLAWEQVAERTIAASFPSNFAVALQNALSTAKSES